MSPFLDFRRAPDMLALLSGAALFVVVPLFFKPVWFGLGLVWLLLTLFFALPVVHLVAKAVGGAGCQYAWSERLCNALFRLVFGSCLWLRIDGPSSADWDAHCPDAALRRGAVCMVNHTSYVDGFLFSALAPQRVIARARTLMKGARAGGRAGGGVSVARGEGGGMACGSVGVGCACAARRGVAWLPRAAIDGTGAGRARGRIGRRHGGRGRGQAGRAVRELSRLCPARVAGCDARARDVELAGQAHGHRDHF
jgi:hypothetical protein